MKDKNEMRKIKRKLGAVIVLGIFAALMLAQSAVATPVDLDPGDWVGLSASEARITFGEAGPPAVTDEIYILDANVDIGNTDPDFKLEVTGTSGSGFFGVTESSDGDIFKIDNNGRVGIGTASPGTTLDVHGGATIGNYQCSATGANAVAMGSHTTAGGDYSVAMGWETTASGDYSFAQGGMNTVASGDGSVAIGALTQATNFFSVAIGFHAVASGTYSCAMGTYVTASNYDSYVIGRGAYDCTPLVNNIQSSFMVGFDSTEPTLFVDGNSVGIGITSPTAKVHIIQTSLTDDAFRVDDEDYINENTPFVIDKDGNVGIGTATPNEKLEVYGKIKTNTCFNVAGQDGTTRIITISDSSGTHTLYFIGGILYQYTLT